MRVKVTTDDLLTMFDEYLDANYNHFQIDELVFYPSEILKHFEEAYDNKFKTYTSELGLSKVINEPDDDSYYIDFDEDY